MLLTRLATLFPNDGAFLRHASMGRKITAVRALMIAVLLLSFVVSRSAVFASPLEDGYAAYTRGDYATALRAWRPLAKGGNASAQFNLGLMYDKGQGVDQDFREAVKWYRLAAVQGNASAQLSLGLMYHKGQGVDQDFHAAVQWFQSAAAQGDVNAQVNLGVMYANGDGISQDFKEAMKWFRLAAVQGDTLAQFRLGLMYQRAEGVPQDLLRGHMWFTIAAAQGYVPAGKKRDDLSKLMTEEQIAQAEAMARKCEESRYKQCD